MARLIPRKQIEEQQNVSGSLTIGQDLIVGGNIFASGTLQIDNSFYLGDALTDRGEVTGSVFITGSLTIDGNLKVAAPETILSVTASNAVQSEDTVLYAGIRAKDFGANVPTLYVSSTDGNDTNDGRSIQYPLRTIKRAAQLAEPGYDGRYGFDTGSRYNGYVIKVQAGTYLEDNPVILPRNTTIWGSGLRITKINAKNPEQDLFWVNSGCYVAEVTVGGLRLWPDQINPVRGFGFAFQPGAFITTSPYVQNCSQISNQENSFTELYEDIPPGGGGLYVNGDVVNPDSPLASMVLDAYTQISPNGVGCLVNGRGFIQLVSFFNNFSYYAIRVNNGGHATLNNSNISFGLYGMYASGSRFISGSGGNVEARDKVREGWSVVVDVLNRGLDALPDITVLNTDAGIRVNSTSVAPQYYLSGSNVASAETVAEVVSDFNLVSEIVKNGIDDYPTLLAKSSIKGYGFDSPYNILGAEQITSSLSASLEDINHISASYGVILGIFANGTGSYNFTSSTDNLIKISNDTPVAPTSPAIGAGEFVTASVSSSFNTIIEILKNGLDSKPNYVSNNNSNVYISSSFAPFTTGFSSSLAVVNNISASFSIVYNILARGTGSSILPIPENHKRNFNIINVNSSSYNFEGIGNNPTLTLYRGETYKFYVSASEAKGGIDYPFWIRTEKIDGIDTKYDYNKGVINNGDSVGNITFTVPYDAPNTLYYVSSTDSNLGGILSVVNNIETPRYLIANTLTYPATIYSSSVASSNIDIINAYDLLVNNIGFIQSESIAYVNKAWSGFEYNVASCSRDISYIINGVAKDLLYGGNEESIRSGIYYYEYPSQATNAQLAPTLTAIKYAAGIGINLISGSTFVEPNIYRESISNNIIENKEFIKNEVITFLSASWSNFYYNEAKCKRDVGYILDAVATDTLYGGNERSIEAGTFYYLYPSDATGSQLDQTVTGVKYAAGLTQNIIQNKTLVNPTTSSKAAYDLLMANKSLIQNETIQFINVAYPTLEYNETKCRRDVGYIIDAIATDLLYGGNERAVTAGKYYYDYPSIATSIQKKETIGGIRYSKIISEYIIKNIVLDTPRVINNDEKGIRITNQNLYPQFSSSYSGSAAEQNSISSSFSIIEGIIKRGTSVIPSILAQNSGENWNLYNPLSVTTNTQITNEYTSSEFVNKIDTLFKVVTDTISGGVNSLAPLTASQNAKIKVTDVMQEFGFGAANDYVKALLSESISLIGTIISGGLSQITPIEKNSYNFVKLSDVAYTASTAATAAESASIANSFQTVVSIISGGLAVVPTLVSNLNSNIKVTDANQYISASHAASGSDITFISASISKVTQIIETGNVDLFGKQLYTASINTYNTKAAYEILKNNIPFIQDETIAYMSSSWNGFVYDEQTCKRDVGLIISGAAEDLLFNANSASIVNGQFYFEYPSQATDSQLTQTLDAINYASRLAQKLVQNIEFVTSSVDKLNAKQLLLNNKQLIQEETISYLGYAWNGFVYDENKCKRDVGYIVNAVATDLVYGGNERSRTAGIFYYLYPSEATDTQLIQTTDGINYASGISQRIVVGTTPSSAETNRLDAGNVLNSNKELIGEEVVAYVSSSWSEVYYNEEKCKRDVGYIIDAIRTDLVYGGNERSNKAGEFYYLYPSSATVGGVPSSTAQLDPTITGIYYANQLIQNIVSNEILVSPSAEILAARDLIKENRAFIQENTIEYISEVYPELEYNTSKCYRDVGFILDGILTDLVWGGNERSRASGIFYYRFPSKAIDEQSVETINSINFAKELTKLISQGGKAIEDSYDIVSDIIESGSIAIPTLVENSKGGIKATNVPQYTTIYEVVTSDKNIVSSSFGNVLTIISNGTGSIPTEILNTTKGIKIGGVLQLTSSITPNILEVEKVNSAFNTVLDIIANGTGSLPIKINNSKSNVKISSGNNFTTTASISQTNLTSSLNSFDIVLNIIENGTSSLPNLIRNVIGGTKLTNTNQTALTENISKSLADSVTGSFNIITNILQNGTGSIPTLVSNTFFSKTIIGNEPYISASSATNTEVQLISSSISIVSKILEVGETGSIILALPTSSYVSASNEDAKWIAYGILKENIPFIQSETLAYLESAWSTASFNEASWSRDIGLIISGAMEDLVFNSNSASFQNGKYYIDYATDEEKSQLNQRLDGIKYASELAQKVVLNTIFTPVSEQINAAYDAINFNKEFIQNEVIAYISSSWSSKVYDEILCRRDITHIIDAIATDLKWGGNERRIKAGQYYYLYPSNANTSQLSETLTGINHIKNLVDRILRGITFTIASNNKFQAKELINKNKQFIKNEVIAYVSASWSEFYYNEASCSRDIGYVLDAVATDLVYGGNERAREAGKFYYDYPSQATTTQLGPTLTGIKYAKSLTDEILKNNVFTTASNSALTAYDLIYKNKELVKDEVITYLSSSWSTFYYNEASCSRDVGYILDAVATDTLYGGNERSIEAGTYYYLYPSKAIIPGIGADGQLDETLDGVRYAKGITNKIVQNIELVTASLSEVTAHELLVENRDFIQAEVLQYVTSSWSGVDGFTFNAASCSRDIGFIVDAVATDVLYGGNERSSKAGLYYYLYPSAATKAGFATGSAQLQQTLDGVKFGAGISQTILDNTLLTDPTPFVSSSVSLLRQNKKFIQNETIQYIDSFFPYLQYNREKCRRDVGYIVDAVSTDLWYGGNERSIISGEYYYKYPNLATTPSQVIETVSGIQYAKNISKFIAQNIIVEKPVLETNTDNNIKVGSVQQYTSSIIPNNTEIQSISSSFAIVTDIIERGTLFAPELVKNSEAALKVTNVTQYTSVTSGSSAESGIITSSFGLIADIIYNGSASLPDSLANNFNYGFEKDVPSLLHISSINQITSGFITNQYTSSISSSFAKVIEIVNNGTGSIGNVVDNTSSSLQTQQTYQPNTSSINATNFEINTISNLYGIVTNIVENENYPIFVSNTNAGVKVTNTPQLISGSAADRIQSRIISSSFALVIDIITNGSGSQQFFNSAYPTANSNEKINAAYNLLLGNQQMIIDETITYMSSSWSTFDYTQSKCERDLGLIISGAAFDLLYGGNSASFVNGKFYLEYPSEATGSQLDQTVTALKFASGLAEKVVRNTVLTHISESLLTSASYVTLRTNKNFIKDEVINYLSSSWSDFDYNETTCKRDIGYIVDAVSTDLLYGGNERSYIAGDYYYRYPSQATDSQLQPTLDGIIYAKGISMQLAKGSQFNTSSADILSGYNILRNNKEFIQDEVVAMVNAKYPHLLYDQTKCRRDVGYIVDAVITDFRWGGNLRSIKAGEFYYKYPSLATTQLQITETITAIDYARRLAEQILIGNVIQTPQVVANGVTPSTDPNVLAAYDLLVNNKSFIQAETIAYVSSSWVDFIYNEASCSRDVGYIVDAVATDLLYGGNESSANAGIVYFLTASAATGSQLEQTVNAINYAGGVANNIIKGITFVTASQSVSASVELLRKNRAFIQEETMQYLTASWSTFDYDKTKCRRDVGYIVDGVATDLLYGGNERTVMSGEFYYKYPSQATTTQARQTNEGINYASRIAQKVAQNIVFQTASLEASASFDLLRKNKNFIAAEVIEYVSSSWSTVYYNEASCSRDVKYLIDAAATDVLYGGQERSVIAGTYYYIYPSNATKPGVPSTISQLDPTLTGVRYAGRLSKRIVTNPVFSYPSSSNLNGRELLTLNKGLVQKETITFLSSSWSTLQYNEISCSRDVGFIIDAVKTDLVYGGNERSIQAGSYYYLIPSVAIKPSYTDNGTVGQKNQTVDGINYAKGVSEKVVSQTQLVFATTKTRQAVSRLRASKEELKQRAIGYTNGAFPYLVYNEASCSRDTGLIVDAVATDLLYGGNERSIAAASSYFTGQFGNAGEVIFKQRLETLETNRYLRTRAEFIAGGAPLESFGSLIVATGIDYSYNGAGVTFKALPPNQGGSGVANPAFEITELAGGRIFFTSGNQDGDFRIGTGLSINQATGTLVGRTFSKSLFSLVTPFSLALQI